MQGALFASSILSVCEVQRRRGLHVRARRPVLNSSSSSSSGGGGGGEEIRAEMLSRIVTFFGNEAFAKLENAFVIVVGLGGVGSHAANMLARSGVAELRLIDFDQVTLSSLNRHALASMADVGKSKAEVMRSRLLEIAPWCRISAVTEMFKASEADRLLAGRPCYVLDCIDDVSTKAELIAYCYKNNLKCFTSLGAGGKSDPTRLRITALDDCINDPLASKLKWKLKKFDVPAEDVMSVFSIEKPCVDLLPLDEDQVAAPQDYGAVDYLRIRVMPVLGTSPSIFGQAMASYVLCCLADKEYIPEACERLSKNLKHKMRQTLQRNEHLRFKTSDDLDIDDDDVEFIVLQVWKSRCAVTGKRFGGHAPLVLTRWDPKAPLTPFNLVLMMQTHATAFAEGKEFPDDVKERIEGRLAWAKQQCKDAWLPDRPQSVKAAQTRTNSVEKGLMYLGSEKLLVFALGAVFGCLLMTSKKQLRTS